ncbi:hypothetical protein D3C80_1430160 [compost metagenome]
MLLLVPQIDIDLINVITREGQAACLMVRCNYNGGVAVFLREFNRGLKCGIEVECFLNKGRQIIGMTGMVNTPAFNHHHKSVLISG